MSRRWACFLVLTMVLGLTLSSTANGQIAGWWKFDEGSGTVASDSSGNGNDGALEGDPQWVAGKLGGAIEGDGTGDYVRVPHSESLNISDAVTIAMWLFGGLPPDQPMCKGTGGAAWQTGLAIRLDDNPSRAIDFRGRTSGAVGLNSISTMPTDEWYHVAATFDLSAQGNNQKIYINGILDAEKRVETPLATNTGDLLIGADAYGTTRWHWQGMIDDVRIYREALNEGQIQAVMAGAGAEYPFASRPIPADGAIYTDTWINLSWSSGDFAVSHDVYLSDNFEDVNEGIGDAFRGNQTANFYVAGFPGFAYPDGLVPGTTYYWRIDEVNDVDPNSPWKGPVWSFSIPPKKAYDPNPADGAEGVPLNASLRWTAGFGAKLHTIYFGESYDEVSNATVGKAQGTASYSPGALKFAKTYYWRVDEFDAVATYKGDVWSFTTQGAVGNPNPANGVVGVEGAPILSWNAGALAATHEVYFGADLDTIKNATKASPEYKGTQALGNETYDPGVLLLNTAYYWRIDEVNSTHPDSPWTGNVWSFTTGNFYVVDDFESYNDIDPPDAASNRIFDSWIDGFGTTNNGALVGNDLPPYAERTIVHGGSQSMPFRYDNNLKSSEAVLTLVSPRDWTTDGVTELSIWFRGYPASVGSFVEGPVGTYTMTAAGADIWGTADQFHFAYKTLTGIGSIEARIESVGNTNPWAKAGVMIRETLEPGSKFAAVYITPTNADGTPTNGCRFQARTDTGVNATSDSSVVSAQQTAIVAPYWVKIERDIAGNFRGYYSNNGTVWQAMTWNPQSITMNADVYIGLALTSHNNAAACEAKFSNVKTTGTAGPLWAHQDIGIASNDPEPLYVETSNITGQRAIVVHDNAAAANVDTWTQWLIPLSAFADKGVTLTNVNRIAIGLGTKGSTAAEGSGTIYFDDIRLYRPNDTAGQ